MRVSQKPNRTRGRGQRKPSGSNINRVYESSGPEGKVRGTPQQIIDKYLSLARDAQTSGHRIVAENFLQHAEHYQRLLVEAMDARQERNPNQQPSQQSGHEQPGHEHRWRASYRRQFGRQAERRLWPNQQAAPRPRTAGIRGERADDDRLRQG
jgi:hypothetical protein